MEASSLGKHLPAEGSHHHTPGTARKTGQAWAWLKPPGSLPEALAVRRALRSQTRSSLGVVVRLVTQDPRLTRAGSVASTVLSSV